MMNDREILLRAISALPDDDAPRYAYADWLEENNDARQAEFIRVQLVLDRLPANEREKHPAAEREQALWRDLKKWRYILGDWLMLSLSHFHRGFNRSWSGTQTEVINANDQFWRLGPVSLVTFGVHSKLSQAADNGAAVAQSKVLHQFEQVMVTGRGLSDDWLEAFLQSPYMGRWQGLHLVGDSLTDRAVQLLIDSPLLLQGCRLQIANTNTTTISDSARLALDRAQEAVRQAKG